MTVASTDVVRDDRAAVDKAICLLTSFGEDAGTGVGVSELARRASLSKSTAYRVLGLLERNGVVERVGSDYRFGAQLEALGRSANPVDGDFLRELFTPHCLELYEATHHTVRLGVLQGPDVVFVVKLFGLRHRHTPWIRHGNRFPAAALPSGRVLLAHADPELAEPDDGPLADDLASVRSHGLLVDDQRTQPGVGCVAAPILDSRGRAAASLSVCGPSPRIDLAATARLLRRVAAAGARDLARAQAVNAQLRTQPA